MEVILNSVIVSQVIIFLMSFLWSSIRYSLRRNYYHLESAIAGYSKFNIWWWMFIITVVVLEVLYWLFMSVGLLIFKMIL